MYKYFSRTSDSSIYITEYYCQIDGSTYFCARFRLNEYSDDEYFLDCCYFSHIEEKLKLWREKKDLPIESEGLPQYVMYAMVAGLFA